MLQKFKVPGPAGTSLAGRPAVLTVSRNGPQQDAGAKAQAGKQAFPEGLRSRARARSEGLRAVLLHVVTVPSSRFCSPQCGAAFQEDDVIVLNGTKEDVAMLQTRMEERRLRAKLGKVPEPWVCPSPARAWVRVKSSGAAQPRPLLRGQPPTCRLGVCSDWGRFYDPEVPGL